MSVAISSFENARSEAGHIVDPNFVDAVTEALIRSGYKVSVEVEKPNSGLLAGENGQTSSRVSLLIRTTASRSGADASIPSTVPEFHRIRITPLDDHLEDRLPSGTNGYDGEQIVVDRLILNRSDRTCCLDGDFLELTTAEFDLLWYLAEHSGNVVSRTCIHRDLFGLNYDGLDRSIDLRVSRLRRKLGDDPARPVIIKSVRGVGYILAARNSQKRAFNG